MFATLLCEAQNDTFVDSRDGKIYKTVQIGKQVWMAQNLAFTDTLIEAVCYWNSSAVCDKYGSLYTWYAAVESCPKGWHLPSQIEFDSLIGKVAGDKKTAYNVLILGGGSGFDGLLGGYVSDLGLRGDHFIGLEKFGFYLNSSAKPSSADASCFQFTTLQSAKINKGKKGWLMSVRCVKD